MTNSELDNEFDLLYSNNANVGPGLDVYDKSVFLTIAQEEIVNNYYSPKSNSKGEGFEQSEKRRRDLEKITVPAISTTKVQTTSNISPNSYTFTIEPDVRFIVHERIKVASAVDCINNTFVDVEPVTHDEYNIAKDNPFKKPNGKNAWRMDISDGTTNNLVEIVGADNYTPTAYHYRYIKTLSPIVLSNLPGGLTINGVSTATECKLQPIAREILHRAVELALEVSSNPRFNSKVQLDTRNE